MLETSGGQWAWDRDADVWEGDAGEEGNAAESDGTMQRGLGGGGGRTVPGERREGCWEDRGEAEAGKK